ncbi:MAG: hypothetical protein ACYCVN_05360 [Acidimicrobiales bacterium]
MSPPGPRPVGRGREVAFSATIRLTKGEAFAACQALADADRILASAGNLFESRAIAELFELMEERLVAERPGPFGSGRLRSARARSRWRAS